MRPVSSSSNKNDCFGSKQMQAPGIGTNVC